MPDAQLFFFGPPGPGVVRPAARSGRVGILAWRFGSEPEISRRRGVAAGKARATGDLQGGGCWRFSGASIDGAFVAESPLAGDRRFLRAHDRMAPRRVVAVVSIRCRRDGCCQSCSEAIAAARASAAPTDVAQGMESRAVRSEMRMGSNSAQLVALAQPRSSTAAVRSHATPRYKSAEHPSGASVAQRQRDRVPATAVDRAGALVLTSPIHGSATTAHT